MIIDYFLARTRRE